MSVAPDSLPIGEHRESIEDSLVVDVRADLEAVADVRRIVRRFADAHLTERRLDDLVLAASELASNAVEHANAPSFSLVLERTASAVRLAVQSAAALGLDLAALTRPDALADPTAPRGRGLGIVRALSDQVHLWVADGVLTVCCRFART